jgi:hypothetical protein
VRRKVVVPAAGRGQRERERGACRRVLLDREAGDERFGRIGAERERRARRGANDHEVARSDELTEALLSERRETERARRAVGGIARREQGPEHVVEPARFVSEAERSDDAGACREARECRRRKCGFERLSRVAPRRPREREGGIPPARRIAQERREACDRERSAEPSEKRETDFALVVGHFGRFGRRRQKLGTGRARGKPERRRPGASRCAEEGHERTARPRRSADEKDLGRFQFERRIL